MMRENTLKMIPIYVMGRRYEVPQGLTLLKAFEYAGYRMTRGCGCRGGVCGACVTIYRNKGDYRLKTGLACQTVVEPHMYLTLLPYIPAHKAFYTIQTTPMGDLNAFYPEIMRCVACNTCTKVCPMGLDVMNYMAAAIRGDLEKVVELSIECVMCGLCAANCPAELAPFNVALLIRRLHGRHSMPPSPQLQERLQEIGDGKFDKELDALKRLEKAGLEKMFKELQATRGEAI